MSKSAIEWTEQTWNPIAGCRIVSPGCTNCYAMKMAARIEAMNEGLPAGHRHGGEYIGTTRKVNGNPVWTGIVRLADEDKLLAPLRRKKPTTYFVNSMGDLFHEDVPDEWIDKVFAVMALCPQHTFQVLTKRSARMRSYFSPGTRDAVFDAASAILRPRASQDIRALSWDYPAWPLPNVWLGVSTEDQRRADERIPDLLATPAAIRFISAEPLLGPVDITAIRRTKAEGFMRPLDGRFNKLDWVITGGESGTDARPMHPHWARSLRDQCAAAGVSFFFKQWGNWAPCDAINVSRQHALCGLMGSPPHIERDWTRALDFLNKSRGIEGTAILADVGKAKAGRLLDGIQHNGMPEAAR